MFSIYHVFFAFHAISNINIFFFVEKQFFLISRFMLFSTLKNIEKCPFTYWLNGRWFLQIVDMASPDGWAVWGVVVSTRWWLLVDHCVMRNWDRILVRAVKGLISRAGMVSICPLLWQRDIKLQQTNQIVDRDSWNIYPLYPLFPCSDFVSQMWGWLGRWGCNVFLTFYAISNISRTQNLGIQNNYFSFNVFFVFFFVCWKYWKVPLHLQLLVKWYTLFPPYFRPEVTSHKWRHMMTSSHGDITLLCKVTIVAKEVTSRYVAMHVMFTIATQCLCCCYAMQCLCCCYVRVLSLICGRRHIEFNVATQCLCCCYVRVLSLTCGRRHFEFNVATQCLCCCYVRVLSLTCGRRHFVSVTLFTEIAICKIVDVNKMFTSSLTCGLRHFVFVLSKGGPILIVIIFHWVHPRLDLYVCHPEIAICKIVDVNKMFTSSLTCGLRHFVLVLAKGGPIFIVIIFHWVQPRLGLCPGRLSSIISHFPTIS